MATPVPFDLTMARQAFATAAQLHGRATRIGTPNLAAEDFAELRAADAAYITALGEGRVAEAIDADDAFHDVLVRAADDPDVRVSVELLAPRLRRLDLWFFTRKMFDEPPSSHREIVEALERGDAERAASLVEASFIRAGETLAAALRRGDGR
ncbi:MAG TPA: FCD domain-containing protein [Baekduia sp.]|nr:FCD domain-containing protein [Baekduia sp.]